MPPARQANVTPPVWVSILQQQQPVWRKYIFCCVLATPCFSKQTAQFAPPPQAPQRSSKRIKKQRRPPAPVRLLDQDVIKIDSGSDQDNASSVSEEQIEKVSPTDLYLSLILYFLNTGDVSTECCWRHYNTKTNGGRSQIHWCRTKVGGEDKEERGGK